MGQSKSGENKLLGRKAFVIVQGEQCSRSFHGVIECVDYKESLVLSNVEERTITTMDDYEAEFDPVNHVFSSRTLPLVLINREDMVEIRIK